MIENNTLTERSRVRWLRALIRIDFFEVDGVFRIKTVQSMIINVLHHGIRQQVLDRHVPAHMPSGSKGRLGGCFACIDPDAARSLPQLSGTDIIEDPFAEHNDVP